MYRLVIFSIILLYFLYRIRIFFRTSRKNIIIALDNKDLVPVFKNIFLLNDLNIRYKVTDSKDESYDLLKRGVVDFALLREDQEDIDRFEFVCGLYKEYLTFLIDNSQDNIFTNVNDDYFDYELIKDMKIKWHDKTISKFFDNVVTSNFITNFMDKIMNINKKTDGIMLWSHHPNNKIEDVVSKNNFGFFNLIFDNDFSKKHPYYKKDHIDINKVYQNIVGVDKNRLNYIKTYSSRVVLMCNKNTNNVYSIVKNIFDNRRYLEELKYIEKINTLSSSNPVMYNKIKIHNGASKYYKSISKIKIHD